jgi:hypothetical protein
MRLDGHVGSPASCSSSTQQTLHRRHRNDHFSLSLGNRRGRGLLGCVAISGMFSLPVLL